MPYLKHSSKFPILPIAVTILLLILILSGTFFMGMRFGEFRASYSAMRHFRDAGFPPDIVRSMRPGNGPFGPGKHGLGGIISAVDSGSIVIQRMDGSSQVVFTSDTTKVESKEGTKTISDISLGAHVIVIGKPNSDDAIEAMVLLLP